MKRIPNHLSWALWALIWLIGCLYVSSCEPRCETELTLAATDTLFVGGTQESLIIMQLQWPFDCEKFDYDGEMTVTIVDPTTIPGLQLYLSGGINRPSIYRSRTFPSSDGDEEVILYGASRIVNGVPVQPTAGTYKVTLLAEFSGTFDGQGILERDQTEVEVVVSDQTLGITFIAPQAGADFASTENVLVQFQVSDPTNLVEEIVYTIDAQEERVTLTPPQASVEITDTLTNLSPGNKTLTVSARNGRQESVSRSRNFLVTDGGGSSALTEVRWDGEGDGVSWLDGQNWAGDQVPTAANRAIVDLVGTERIVIGDLNASPARVQVGSVDIKADVLLENGATLTLEASDQLSFIRGTTRFNFPQTGSYQDPTLAFGTTANNATLRFQDTVFLSNATFDAMGITPGNRFIIENAAFDPIGTATGAGLAGLNGPVTLELAGNTYTQDVFEWSFNLAERGNGNPRLINTGTWTMNGATLFRYEGFDGGKAFLENRSRMSVLRVATPSIENTNNRWEVDGDIVFTSTGTWTDESFETPFPGEILLNTTHNEVNTIASLFTDSEIWFGSGNTRFTQSLSVPSIYVDYRGALGSNPVVDLEQVDLRCEQVEVDDGALTLGTGTIQNLSLDATGFNFEGRIDFKGDLTTDIFSVTEGTFEIDCGRTVSVRLFVASRKLSNTSCASGTLELRQNTDPTKAFLQPTDGSYLWNGTIDLLPGATLQWFRGDFYGNQQTTATIKVAQGARLEIDNLFGGSWGYQNGNRYSQLNIENAGDVVKRGDSTVQIRGCLTHIGTSKLTDANGTLQVDSEGLTCN